VLDCEFCAGSAEDGEVCAGVVSVGVVVAGVTVAGAGDDELCFIDQP
jgi:hypothetical protein